VNVPSLDHAPDACGPDFFETELIAIASTNFVATSARTERCFHHFAGGRDQSAGTRLSTNAAPSPKIPMFAFFFDGFDLDRFNFFVVERSDMIVLLSTLLRALSFQRAVNNLKSGIPNQ